MDNERLSIKKYKQYVLLGQLISVGLLVIGLIFINQKQNSVLQIAGWILFALGIVFIVSFNRRKRRLLWVYKNTSPILMKMNLEKKEDLDSTYYVAHLLRQDNNPPEKWKASLYSPSYDVQQFLNNENQVQVYIDPKNNNPAIIKTTGGLLWVMAGSGTVQKLN